MVPAAPYTIRSLFEEPFRYSVPSYQRAYAWDVDKGDRQVRQFIDDLAEQHPGKQYYLGHFLFEQGEGNRRSVIAGQQRLTTVVIFLAAVINELGRRLREDDPAITAGEMERLSGTYLVREDGRRFETVHPDQEFFRARVFDRNSSEPGDTLSRKQIAAADAWLSKTCRQADTAELLQWIGLVENAVITTYTVTDKIQATQIFAFQNDRGKKLTKLEKLKAFLMYQVYLVSDQNRENDEIRDVESAFASIYTSIPRIDWLNEDQVLDHHCTAYLSHGEASDAIKPKLKKLQGKEKLRWITGFASDLKNSFQHCEKIEAMAFHHQRIADPLILDPGNAWPMMLKLYRHHRDALLAPKWDRLLRLIEMVLFKAHFLHGRCSNDLPKWAFELQEGGEANLQARLERASVRGFRGQQDCNGSFRSTLAGHHHWSGLFRYLLWKHENHIRDVKDHHISPGTYMNDFVTDSRMNSTLDHIFPRKMAEELDDLEFWNESLNDLGNLMLMNHSMNSSLGKKAPLAKADIMLESTFRSHRDVAAQIQKDGTWGAAQIKARKDTLVSFALAYWEAAPQV